MIYYFVVHILLKVKEMKFYKKEIFTIPNILTYIRIIIVPFFIWMMMDGSIDNHIYIAFGLFIFASVTDLVDGFIARRFNLITDIGKIADPIADKLLQVSTLLCLTLLDKIHMVFPIIYFIKESYMVLGGSCIVKIFKSEYVLQSNIFGKCATCLNSLGIVLGFFVGEVNRAYDIAVNVILVCGAVFAITTAGIYTMQFIKFRKNELAAKKVIAETKENVSEETETSFETATGNIDNKFEIEKVCESTDIEVEEKVISEKKEASND